MKKPLLLIAVLTITGILILIIFIFFKNSFSSDFRINEISFTNNDGNDWIEIYNPSLNTRSLRGMYLTDKKEESTKYEIRKTVIIPPNGFIVIYGKNYYEEGEKNVLKTNFAIKNGETIYLLNQNQEIIDSLTALADENSLSEMSIGRFPDGSEDIFSMSTPTRGEENKKDILLKTNPPKK